MIVHVFLMIKMVGTLLCVRASDEQNLLGSKHKIIGSQHLMGPFLDKHLVEDWLEGFLAIHFENRSTDISTINLQH